MATPELHPQSHLGPLSIDGPTSQSLSLSPCVQTKVSHSLSCQDHVTADVESLENGLKVEECTTLSAASSTVPANPLMSAGAPGPLNPFAGLSQRISLLSKCGSTVDAAELGDLVPLGQSLQALFNTGPTEGIWWLDISKPTAEEVKMLANAFSIHPLTSEDIKTGESHEKLEVFNNYYFVLFRSFNKIWKAGKYVLEPCSVYMIVFPQGILSFSLHPSLHATNVRNRIRTLRDGLRLNSDWICYALIDDIVDSFSPLITEIEQEASAIEDSVFLTRVDELSSVLLRVHDCRKKNMNTIHFLRDKAVVIKSLARHWDEAYLETPRNKIGLFLGDVQDHVVTKMSKLEHFEDILSRSHSDYITRLSVDKIGNRTRTLKVIIRLTIVAGIVIPLNVICGLFGMNVQVPGQHVEGLGWWFGILGGIVLFVVVSLATARIKKVI